MFTPAIIFRKPLALAFRNDDYWSHWNDVQHKAAAYREPQMNTVQILVNAKKAVKRSWTKGAFLLDGAACAAGGIGKVLGSKTGHPLYDGLAKGDLLASGRALKYLAHAVAGENGEDLTPVNGITPTDAFYNVDVITSWNDSASQTLAGVMRGFDKAIKMAKRRHIHG